ncbi:uncharacterized protein LOC124365602 [Homalodisca vitripennis]|uniref:uncharacterized protein LOC124365602 n=1 Tax=Homalodisca vitripennis TaxID=197043 RepID=UPI001EEBB740|nr:uncharacterized protein LOC124365602 [Homalodisca vitripennis]
MKEQATKLHLENVKLKKQMEDLERDMKSELFFRESCVSKQSKNQEMIESLTVQIHNLDKDYRNTERHSSQALSLGSKCQLMLEHKDKIITQLQTRVKELSAELVSLNNKNMNLENDLKEQKPPEKHYVREILQEIVQQLTSVPSMSIVPAGEGTLLTHLYTGLRVTWAKPSPTRG